MSKIVKKNDSQKKTSSELVSSDLVVYIVYERTVLKTRKVVSLDYQSLLTLNLIL